MDVELTEASSVFCGLCLEVQERIFSLLSTLPCSVWASGSASAGASLLSPHSYSYSYSGREEARKPARSAELATVPSRVHSWPITLAVRVWGSDWFRTGSDVLSQSQWRSVNWRAGPEPGEECPPERSAGCGSVDAGTNTGVACLLQPALLVVNYNWTKKEVRPQGTGRWKGTRKHAFNAFVCSVDCNIAC